MDPLASESRRPRPVAGLPVVDTRAVAKAWLLELVADAPLDAAAAVPVADVAREGPGLAAAVLEALSDDAALARLAPGGNLAWMAAGAARLAGASSLAGAVRSAEALRRAVGTSLHAAGRIDPLTAAELADRLAHVCSLVAVAGVGAPAPATAPTTPSPDDRAPDAASDGPLERPEAAGGSVEPPSEPPSGPPSEPPSGPPAEARRRAPPARAPALRSPEPEGSEAVGLRRAADPIEALRAREQRRAEAGGWQPVVERQLERHAHDGSPFALLAIEVDGLDRLRAAEADDEVQTGLDRLERALAAELRPADQLLREEPGRYWVSAPDTGPAVARLLAERIAEAAAGAASHHGAPLAVSIGVATCPDDGEEAEALAGRADQGMFAARAAGTSVA